MKRWIATGLWLLAIPMMCIADGKVYGIERVPPTIPYQRALICYRDGIETLFLQSRYSVDESSVATTLGWVVPVPAVPELAGFEALMGENLFLKLAVNCRPHVIVASDVLFYMSLCGSLGGTYLLMAVRFRARFEKYRPPLINLMCYVFLATLVWGVFAPDMMGPDPLVDVIKSEHVGIYDVRVIAARNADDLLEWLNTRGFRHDQSDRAVFDAYIADGWCFVAAHINPRPEHSAYDVSLAGLAAPLTLRFPCAEPVYPLALTGTGGHDTEVLLYVASDAPMACDGRMNPLYAGETWHRWQDNLVQEVDPRGFFTEEQLDFPYLQKFKGTLTPRDMETDLIFYPATDASRHRSWRLEW